MKKLLLFFLVVCSIQAYSQVSYAGFLGDSTRIKGKVLLDHDNTGNYEVNFYGKGQTFVTDDTLWTKIALKIKEMRIFTSGDSLLLYKSPTGDIDTLVGRQFIRENGAALFGSISFDSVTAGASTGTFAINPGTLNIFSSNGTSSLSIYPPTSQTAISYFDTDMNVSTGSTLSFSGDGTVNANRWNGNGSGVSGAEFDVLDGLQTVLDGKAASGHTHSSVTVIATMAGGSGGTWELTFTNGILTGESFNP